MSKLFSFSLVSFVFSSIAFAGGPIADKVWDCSFDDQKSAIMLAKLLQSHPKYSSKGEGDYFGMHLSEIKSLSVTIKDGKIVDGKAEGANAGLEDDQSWDLKKTIAVR